ncbi:MAG: nucleotidyl transferase AbiEii/AbiGii toxin family protein [Ruminiclostridium sp.]|nr:nucleotidyl transferase AbiEii/AbiGii toxin family protein [Ruminiclostridium sp.]
MISNGANIEKIGDERSNKSKSMWCWFDDEGSKVKLEIGCSARPDPYSKRKIKTYIQEFLEANNGFEDIEKYGLHEVTLNVLSIERTFVDKLMAVKRHATCGNLQNKVRHIYDVTRLYTMPEIKAFLEDRNNLKKLLALTKETDTFYLEKRKNAIQYDPKGAYDFDSWKDKFTSEIKTIYEKGLNDLIYNDKKRNFDDVFRTFSEINSILKSISE